MQHKAEVEEASPSIIKGAAGEQPAAAQAVPEGEALEASKKLVEYEGPPPPTLVYDYGGAEIVFELPSFKELDMAEAEAFEGLCKELGGEHSHGAITASADELEREEQASSPWGVDLWDPGGVFI